MSGGAPLVVEGWTLFAHPVFLDQLESLTTQVEALKRKDPAGYSGKNATKRLAAIAKLAFEVIPQDPARPEFRQGNTLGEEHRHWLRARFFQQYRLFFRFHAKARVIVFAWVTPTTPIACSVGCSTAAARPPAGTTCLQRHASSRSGWRGWRRVAARDTF